MRHFIDSLIRPDWFDLAECSGHDVDVFHPDRGQFQLADKAKLVCAVCPVREQCLNHALVNNEEHGVWGGMTARQRRKERLRRGLQRKFTPAVCGTLAGYRKHARQRTRMCDDCRHAHNQLQNEKRRRDVN